jgi:hypothetical protein
MCAARFVEALWKSDDRKGSPARQLLQLPKIVDLDSYACSESRPGSPNVWLQNLTDPVTRGYLPSVRQLARNQSHQNFNQCVANLSGREIRLYG